MKKSDLKVGMEVALATNQFGKPHIGQQHARKVTVLSGPHEKVYDRETKAQSYPQGKGPLWLIRDPGHSSTQTPERYVDSRKLLAPWADHMAERTRMEAWQRERAAETQRKLDQAEAWEQTTGEAMKELGLDWEPRRVAGGTRVNVPAEVLDKLVGMALTLKAFQS